MTPAEHIDQAEQLVAQAADDAEAEISDQLTGLYTAALAHAVIAIAVELGVPHVTAAPAVTGA